ncbi:glycosyltransferase [Maricaulis sp.]|uniref:glycosyltransferase n=1 Tax=Maricaulis sp. TaxID=1486257 RepID=UPI003A8EDF97
MRIVHLTYTLRGGAGTALRRHHEALREKGIDSQIVVGEAVKGDTPYIHCLKDLVEVPEAKARAFEALARRHQKRDGSGDLWASPESFGLKDTELVRAADIFEVRQLHAGGHRPFFNFRALRAIAREKPVIWRLSDMWAFTGYCAYSLDCERWREGCGPCPQLTTEPEKAELRRPDRDNSAIMWNARRKAFQGVPFHMVFPSEWLLEQARVSLLKDAASFTHIPVGVDPSVFRPAARQANRARLGISKANFVISAVLSNSKNHRKAFDLFADVVGRLRERQRTTLVIVGNVGEIEGHPAFEGLQIVSPGYVGDEAEQAGILSTGDVFLFPSRCDNSAQVLLEAGACALPTVCFDVGGNAEYVREGETGRVIEPFDMVAMSAAVQAYRDDPILAKAHGKAARRFMDQECSVKLQRQRFQKLYATVLAGGAS